MVFEMKAVLSRIHTRLGDLWWYTFLLFAAARCGDLINAFIGLWLVPKYVDVNELGAVLPLSSFASFVVVPIGVLATVLSKQVNVLSVRGEKGQLKTLLRGVFLAVAVFFFVALLVVRLVFPLVLERIRVVEGMLGLVIVAAALTSAVAPVYQNVLQAQKRFGAVSFINVLCAPIRLVVMLISMPFRALTGYFVGQTAGPLFQIAASVFALRKDLDSSVRAAPYWTKDKILEIGSYLSKVALATAAGSLVAFVEPLLIRQRLPEMDSAAFYMISRFAEIGTYLGITLSMIVFPYVSEDSERGRTGDQLILKSMLAAVAFGACCAVALGFLGNTALSLLPNGNAYVAYVPQLVALTLIMSLGVAVTCFTVGESAANRFGWLWWSVPLHVFYVFILMILTGYGYLHGIVPDRLVGALAKINASRLNFLLGMKATFTFVLSACIAVQMLRRKK